MSLRGAPKGCPESKAAKSCTFYFLFGFRPGRPFHFALFTFFAFAAVCLRADRKSLALFTYLWSREARNIVHFAIFPRGARGIFLMHNSAARSAKIHNWLFLAKFSNQSNNHSKCGSSPILIDCLIDVKTCGRAPRAEQYLVPREAPREARISIRNHFYQKFKSRGDAI